MFARGSRFTFLVALLAAWGAVGAAGLSASQSGTVLGQVLDFPVQVRLDAGETLSPECVSAEVHVSDQRLPAATVRALLDHQGNGTARVRVQTQQVIDEPVVSITLRVGCAAPITRRFVVFADPPGAAALAPVPAPPAAATATALPLANTVAAEATRTAAAAAANVSPAPLARDGVADSRPPATGRAAKPVRTAVAARAFAPSQKPPVRSKAATAAAVMPSRPAVSQATAPTPRLSLEPVLPQATLPTVAARVEADAVGAALAAVAQAASAAQVAAVAASASMDRIAQLERTVTQLRSDAQANQTLLAQLREKLDRSQGNSPWLWPLLLTALLLAGLSAWLAWRLGRLQAARQVTWSHRSSTTSAAPESVSRSESMAEQQARARTGPVPFMSTDLPTFPPRSNLGSLRTAAPGTAMTPGFATQISPAQRSGVPGWPTPTQPQGGAGAPDSKSSDSPMARTEPLPASLRGGDSSVRDVSIEELIDLEQQAEFFIVLGQDEAAIDLLVDHLRSTGGGSPLPYLKLLEIYSRNDDRGAYERNRARFNHRFNAYAPEWGSDLGQGRSLEDYPGILPRLEQVWARPLDAMAELEALLFRKSRGELFELPAYREVLFLYALARDLLDRESVDSGTVDLLLPLADGSAFGSTAPIPFLYENVLPGGHNFDFDDHPTGPVDFDLTIPAQQTSMFDPIEEPQRPRRR